MIWSATPYCGENDVLEIRLGTLDSVVDRHVITEATRTQREQPKPLYFDRERFAPWMHKIEYVVVDDMPAESHWARERFQRDVLTRGLDLQSGDLLLVSDLDEIPHPDFVNYEQVVNGPVRLEMDMHMYLLNWRWPERPVRYGTRATLITADYLHDHLPPHAGLTDVVEAGWAVSGWAGWHLAYQMPPEGIRSKVLGIADELQREEFIALDHLEHCRETGADLFGRDFRQCYWCPDEELPPYVLENRERFAHMLIPEPLEAVA